GPDGVVVVEPPDIPDIPEPPDAPLPPIAAALAPDAELTPLPGDPIIGGVPGGVIGRIQGGVIAAPAAPLYQLAQGARAATLAPLAPEAPLAAIAWGQDDKNKQLAIPETELLSLLVDIVKRDADPNVRNEALQGIYRLRSDAAINALIQLY